MMKKLNILTLTLLYGVVLQLIYSHVISVNFSYMGYVYLPVSMTQLLFAYTFAVVPALWMPVKITRPSQVVYWLLFVMVYVPAILVTVHTLPLPLEQILWFHASLFLSFGMLGLIYKVPLLSISSVKMPAACFWGFIFSLSLISYVFIFKAFGMSLSFVSLLNVYDVRSDYKEAAQQSSGLAAYLISWQANVLNPLILGYGLKKKKLWMTAAALLGQGAIFSITGYKSVFFSGALIIAILMAMYKHGKRFGYFTMAGAMGLIIIGWIAKAGFGSLIFSSLFVRRILITPGFLTGLYYDFFSSHEQVHLAHSIFKSFIDYPYSLNPPYLIGSYYFHSQEMSANANIWADGFANFGFWGLFIFPLLLGFILLLYDSVSEHKDLRVACLLIGIPAFSLTNTALLTGLLTHGLGLALVIAYLIPGKRETETILSAGPLENRQWDKSA
ncbi:hypothetical protein LCY76_19820 [Fictibacillus sp. KIGAM418]|uniref:Uncharacterized protein n=1 Tax=Fictibacillus marinisediminis TaxID=2878389 RepID=A0A9X2BFJ4_9BACL|nr:hypothetical protein [Fictibacillus marinisediminis]MCK6258820.1 hypothetical protein [Fictibacillus marinisediminis]